MTEFDLLIGQKNPHAIRLAEERRGLEQLAMGVAVNVSRVAQLSGHIHNMCSEAREALYTREADAQHWQDRGETLAGCWLAGWLAC